MNRAAELLLERARVLRFPALVLGGTVRAGAAGWWSWAGHAPVAELEQANVQLDALEKRGAS